MSKSNSKRTTLTITEKHHEVADKKGLNLSKYLRNKLEQDFPEEFD